jgi:hypothetical protein
VRSSYDIFRGKKNDAVALRAMAADARKRAEDSFQNCDTDGFLSQWANDISAQQFEKQAEIVERGGKGIFTGLYEGDRRVAAKVVERPAYNRPWATTHVWLLRDDEVRKFGRRFIPLSGWKKNSRIQKQLGLRECQELAPAHAITSTGGRKSTGLAGCANAYVTTARTGCPWGTDATPMAASAGADSAATA